MKKDTNELDIKHHTSNNEIEIIKSDKCSCLFCRQTYSARKVNDWVNGPKGMSALCPECGMAAVVGDASGYKLGKAELKKINLDLFGDDYMEKHPKAAKTYVERYEENKITHKAANESLYIRYLSLLASKGDTDSAYTLGMLYEFGTEFTKPDPRMAFSFYGAKCMKHDPSALTRLGILCEKGALGKVDFKGAYECYSKAMALGSMEGLIHFADCYRKGLFVEKNEEYALAVFEGVWDEAYIRFTRSNGKEINIFPDVSYRIGIMNEEGKGGVKDSILALKMFLYAEVGYNALREAGDLNAELAQEFEDNEKRIETISKRFGLTRQDPVFDNDTFADSMEDDNGISNFIFEQYEFVPKHFDSELNSFEFDVTYDLPPLIVDVGSLFCGFVPETIHWAFSGVSSVDAPKGGPFRKVQGNPDEGWDFVNISPIHNEKTVLASIRFYRVENKKSERKLDKAKGKVS